MKVRLSKWGHSLAVRIPRPFAEQIGVAEGSTVEMTASADGIVVTKPKYRLEELLAAVKVDNLHDEQSWGRPVGREEW